MRKVEVSEKVTLTCDSCKKQATSSLGRYCFDNMEVAWLRLFERSDKKYYESKHLVDRKGLDFCSQNCAKQFLTDSIARFILELAPIEDRTKENVFDN